MSVYNAKIISADLDTTYNGALTFNIQVEYERGQQGFGGFALYLPPAWKHHTKQTTAGHAIWRILECADVEYWSKLPGKTIRIRVENDLIASIGHIINDVWFTPKEELK